jgi:hypothetical protein
MHSVPIRQAIAADRTETLRGAAAPRVRRAPFRRPRG